ncbi:PREDICTED: serine-rich and transmembrane domain-containing protein 1 isoform X1 [Condylura cristata]|uniref:serine-rich and transmembrane domain-containing protein 1 isoform X1 n=1 Tax=Condylura cristata TaxID=143302 RepID=UPI0006430368|nr:PREDICTED: serine-rich and transmembrane domain-containing protein 1 isoform X1 [Condylura cristata]
MPPLVVWTGGAEEKRTVWRAGSLALTPAVPAARYCAQRVAAPQRPPYRGRFCGSRSQRPGASKELERLSTTPDIVASHPAGICQELSTCTLLGMVFYNCLRTTMETLSHFNSAPLGKVGKFLGETWQRGCCGDEIKVHFCIIICIVTT